MSFANKITFALCILATAAWGQPAENIIKLVAPQTSGGRSIMECLAMRQSSKTFISGKRLSKQQISNILFAAGGINRSNGKLTIPTARNLQNQSIYAFLPDGVYIYRPHSHTLELVQQGNFMEQCGRQSYHRNASMILIYVSDMSVIGGNEVGNAMCSGTHAGSSAQNVYLYAASENLGTVICGNFDEKKLADLLNLPVSHRICYIQPIGYVDK